MPIYDYECQKCGTMFEIEHGINDDPPRKRCSECRGKLNKVFSPPGIVFKGSGFYVTDSRKKQEAVAGNGSKKKECVAGKDISTAECSSFDTCEAKKECAAAGKKGDGNKASSEKGK